MLPVSLTAHREGHGAITALIPEATLARESTFGKGARRWGAPGVALAPGAR